MSKTGLLRLAAFEADGGRCHYCRRETLWQSDNQAHPRLATVDHIVPRSEGGSRLRKDNVVLACFRCNQARGTSDFASYKAFWDAVAGEFCWAFKGQVTTLRNPTRYRSELAPNHALAHAFAAARATASR
jgi:hypothetical protein